MQNLAILGPFFAGLGVFFIGISALWWVSLQADKNRKDK